MIVKHSDYLEYDLPENWIAEEDDETLCIYDENGDGAMTISFYSVLDANENIEDRIVIMAKNFVEQNNIKLDYSTFVLNGTKKEKTLLYGTGKTDDNWFIKLWLVAKSPRIVFATYQSERKTREVKVFDQIIESMKFLI